MDAILYLGPPSSITQSRLSRELCGIQHIKIRVERLSKFAPIRRPRSKPNARQLKQ